MFDMMWRTYKKVVDQLRPGKTELDVKEAVESALDAGYQFASPLMHGELGGGVAAPPMIHTFDSIPQDSIVFESGMIITPEMFLTLPNFLKAVGVLDTWVVTDGDPRCLNKYPQEVIVI